MGKALYLIEELLLCVDEQQLLLGRCAPPSRDALGHLLAGLADHEAVVTLPAGLVGPLSLRDLLPGETNRDKVLLTPDTPDPFLTSLCAGI